MAASTSPVLTVRPYRASDQVRVLELVNADRLVGQPVATPEMLEEALTGRSGVDGGWWAELADLATEVLVDPDGIVQGVLATAVRPRDGSGLLLWCHGREDPAIVSSLIGRATERLAECPTLHAFDFASALALGLEALPVRHRASTDRALRDAGFTGRDLWRYAHRTLPAPQLAVDAEAVVTPCQDPPGWRIERRDAGQLLGEAVVTTPVQRIGLLSWISVEPAAQGHGLARPLLGRALQVLREHGACEVILYVDDDEPGGEHPAIMAAARHPNQRCGQSATRTSQRGAESKPRRQRAGDLPLCNSDAGRDDETTVRSRHRRRGRASAVTSTQTAQPLLRELIEIPERVHQGDFVLRLTEGVARRQATLDSYVITPQLRVAFDEALGLIGSALAEQRSKAGYLHGSFGSGKSHFMAVLHALLDGDVAARSRDELADLVDRHGWLGSSRFLLVPYHLPGAESLNAAILGGYVDHIRRTHPDAPLPAVYRAQGLLADASVPIRDRMGTEAFLAELPSSGDPG